ncbi:WecB/TagA/CpsF family glycosyltransferase [Candidatus Gottesmanbacteria bacterium]|nr:WecB/TagA/CpsF family glycosyltransferase [Candidatus Gottesmanbacteria bacterium]
MGLNAVKMLEISITTNSKEEILEYIRKYLQKNAKNDPKNLKRKQKSLIVVTPNPEQIMYARADKHFADILNRADIAIPDGIGVVWASKFLKKNTSHVVRAKIAGVELVEELARFASKQGVTIGLIGGRDKVAVEAFECLRRKHPGLTGWAQAGPQITVKDFQLTPANGESIELFVEHTADTIEKTGTGIVFVGFGAPKQEYVIEKLNTQLLKQNTTKSVVFMAVGGSFDVIAGRLQRAPLLMRLIGFEWAWRLGREPWRWKRQLAILKFVWLVFKEKIRIS